MTEALQRLPIAERSIGIYPLSHLGLYLGYEDRLVGDAHDDLHKSWIPNPDQPKLAPEQMQAFARLCIDMLDYDDRMADVIAGKLTLSSWARTMEVAASIYRNYETGELRFFVEPQVVTCATVTSRSADKTRPPIDLITGEEMVDWQEKWHECGRAHSHNTMGTTPSGTDDDSELLTPGFYMIFGEFARGEVLDGYKFRVFSSVVTPYPGETELVRRLYRAAEDDDGNMVPERLTWSDFAVWPDEDTGATFHPDVHKNILMDEPEEWKEKKPSVITGGYLTSTDTKWRGSLSSTKGSWFRFSDDIEEVIEEAKLPKDRAYAAESKMRGVLNNLDELIDDFGYDFVIQHFAPLVERLLGFQLSWMVHETEGDDDLSPWDAEYEAQTSIEAWLREAYEVDCDD